jgi:hypothetical protein
MIMSGRSKLWIGYSEKRRNAPARCLKVIDSSEEVRAEGIVTEGYLLSLGLKGRHSMPCYVVYECFARHLRRLFVSASL